MFLSQADRCRLVLENGHCLLECSLCEAPLHWNKEKEWYDCECLNEVLPEEIRVLVEKYTRTLDRWAVALGGTSLRTIEKPIKKGFWAWVREKLKKRSSLSLPSGS